MEELRVRLERLVRLGHEPIRLSEHKTFTRLLYRNRNQHRHGLYFRRLEHIRRLLKTADKHVAWESVRHAVDGNSGEQSRSKTKPPLSLSSVTLDDLQSIESSHRVLVTAAIPKAAVKITLELICREHFLPFAVATLATLSRLFVIEQRVLSEIRGAVVETKLLLNSEPLAIHSRLPSRCTDDTSEDIGEVVSAVPDAAQEPVSKRDATQEPVSKCVNPRRFAEYCPPRPNLTNSQAMESDGSIPNSKLIVHKPRIETTQRPSLYALMAEHDSRAATMAASRIRFKAIVPDVIDKDVRSDFSPKPIASPVISRKRQAGHNASENVPPTYPLSVAGHPEHARDNDKSMNYQKNGANNVAGKRSTGTAPVGSSSSHSDEDDLDDIFDAMGD